MPAKALKNFVGDNLHAIKSFYFSRIKLPDEYFVKKPVYKSQFYGNDFWDERACGIACIYMVLKTYNPKFSQSLDDLIQETLALKGYQHEKDIGWYHTSLIQVINKNKLKAVSRKFMPVVEVLFNLSKNRYVISSTKSKTGGHLILIYGYDKKNIYFHDPYDKNKSGESNIMKIKDFQKKFNKKAIVVSTLKK